jgi:hypothetical protein
MKSDSRIESVLYQHPLAYLLGLEGIALLHAFAGDYDRDFTLARFDEIRALLDAAEELGDGVTVDPIPGLFWRRRPQRRAIRLRRARRRSLASHRQSLQPSSRSQTFPSAFLVTA